LYALIVGSFFLNLLMCGALGIFRKESDDIQELHYSGEEGSRSRIAIVRVEGVLMEGMTRFYIKQIEQAARDDKVKAVVLRIDSPGGTISASEEIHRLLIQVRDGKMRKFPDSKSKKIIVSMGAIAASGGYYIAMPGEKIFAEKTCITGSIGVYASFPNVSKFINEHGVKFELVRAGAIKASGSPFHEMTPQEREPWQEMVDNAYDQFLSTVEEGRANVKLSKAALRDEVLVQKQIPVRGDKGEIKRDWWGWPITVEYVRRRADGGTFTAAEALKYKLIDAIGELDDAIDAAAAAAELTKYEAITYERPPSFINSLLGVKAAPFDAKLDPHRLANGMTPRLWFLAPQADFAGILAAMGKE
jgi:protease-4